MIFNSLFKNYNNLVFLTVNTTGFNPKEDRVIELAACKLSIAENGKIAKSRADMLVRLPGEQTLPEEIVRITGITDEMLSAKGMDEEKVSATFASAIGNPKTLLIAHNANFHLTFLESMLRRSPMGYVGRLYDCDYLDTMTILKDRKPYPHRLENVVEYYDLRAISESKPATGKAYTTMHLLAAMQGERDDIASYINVFGYNPRYGTDGTLPHVNYLPQIFHDSIAEPEDTLPAIAKDLELEG